MHSEQFFRTLVEHSADAIMLFTTDGTIVYANPSTASMTGYALQELTGMNSFAFIHLDDKEHVLRLLADLSEQAENSLPLEYRLRYQDGTWRWVEGTATNLLHDPAVGAIVYSFRDITEQKQRFANVVGVMVIDEAGHIYEVNDWMVRALGYSREELLSGKIRVQDLLVPEYRSVNAWAWKTLISQGSCLPEEKIYLCKDGRRLPVLEAIAAMNQERSRALVVSLDISDRKEAEQRREAFLSMVNHELRTPLTVIQGFLELALFYIERLARTSVGEEDEFRKLNKMLQQAQQQVEIESRLVTELLDVSRMDLQKFSLSLQRCDLVSLVRQVVANQQQMVPTRRLELELPPHTLVSVMADADRIEQVINNYLSNAFKYSPPDRKVLVSMWVEGSMVRVSVRDQGPGLTLEQQQRVWERFYQVETTRYTDTFDGLGLGLYIVHSIIAQHQGQVGVESIPGQGSTFWFTLRLADDQDDTRETQYVMGGEGDDALPV